MEMLDQVEHEHSIEDLARKRQALGIRLVEAEWLPLVLRSPCHLGRHMQGHGREVYSVDARPEAGAPTQHLAPSASHVEHRHARLDRSRIECLSQTARKVLTLAGDELLVSLARPQVIRLVVGLTAYWLAALTAQVNLAVLPFRRRPIIV
jgi:hypothetical protein